jgi:two-component system chemotaxis sensor kinase CheA
MSFEVDNEILRDFLVEAGEILESLSEELVELENDAENEELLNSIFRGFHTIKGGAGFLSLTELVDVCHCAENIFDLVRRNQRQVDAELIDTILQALDTINAMFELVQNRGTLIKADEQLLLELEKLSELPPNENTSLKEGHSVAEPLANEQASEASSEETSSSIEEITQDEFEKMLDEIHGTGNFDNSKKDTTASETNDINKTLPEHNASITKAPSPQRKSTTPKTKDDIPPKKNTSPAAKIESTIRVDTKRLDEIMNMVGELVLVRNRLTSLGIVTGDEILSKALTNLDAVTTDLQGAVMKTRMQPIKKVFGRFPRVVRDLARSLKKEIKLILEGEDTDLDKNLVEALADPLVHLVRNSVDHGIELPNDREKAGKKIEGTIILKASQEGDHILLTIKDDGAGMDAEKLKSIAVEKGFVDNDTADKMPDKEAFNLIFAPGFSTKTEISEISGRGVGMDVVKTKITQLNGSINIDSEIGRGTILEIKVPLTLAILPTLMVNIGTQIFALPLASVHEIFHLGLNETNKIDGQLTITVRDKAIPLFYLDKWLSNQLTKGETTEKGHVVIMQIGEQQVALVVDSLIGQEEVVIKPLDNLLHGTPGISGATITRDGGIALIVNVPNLLKFHGKKIG